MKVNNQALVNIDDALLQPLMPEWTGHGKIQADILRLDRIHDVISGNKWFKLKYHLEEALEKRHPTILTFGGAWSNHIIATAYAAQQSGLGSIGIIRGEQPIQLSKTLLAATTYGMRLEYISRSSYAAKQDHDFIKELANRFGNVYMIPEGGAGRPGIKGAMEILSLVPETKYSHIICCIGTGTMYAGIVLSSAPSQEIIGITVLKGLEKTRYHFSEIEQSPGKLAYCKIIDDYHFGGYAKKTPVLLQFMNDFYKSTGIPTDFVYTGKLLYAFNELVKKDYFPPGSNILVIHSGGLQGNSSLPEGTLLF